MINVPAAQVTMAAATWLIVSLLLSTAHSSDHHKHIIFVDEVRGVENTSCWYGGVDMPCKTLFLANKGRELDPDVLIATINSAPSHSHQLKESMVNVNHPVSNPECPPWMYRDQSSRQCNCSTIPYGAVYCDPTIPRTSLLDCFCMTYDNVQNRTQLGTCIFGNSDISSPDYVYNNLPNNTADLDQFMCGRDNRTSTLCGKCKDGYSPLVYSYKLSCMNCTGMNHNWIKYAAVAYVPLTAFFFLVVLFKFSGTSPLLRAFITVSQGLSSPVCIRVLLRSGERSAVIDFVIKSLATLYGVWNLDFFRTIIPPICLNITPLQALLLDYGIAFYPILLIIVSYILIRLYCHNTRLAIWIWKPFKRCFNTSGTKWEVQGSIVNAFATFLLLSYMKVLVVSFDLLVYTEIYNQNGSGYTITSALYYDASVEMFSKEHLPYAITAIIVLLIINVTPLLFLVFYPMKVFQKCLNALRVQRESVTIFIDCFQGYYKDGTNGTRDYRYLSVAMNLLQVFVFCFFAVAKSSFSFPVVAVTLILLSVLILACQPYKEQFKVYTLVDAFILLSAACLLIMISALNVAITKAEYFKQFAFFFVGLFGCLPLIYFLGLCIWWIIIKNNLGRKLITKLRSHFTRCQNSADDFEREPDRLQNPMNYSVPTVQFPQNEGININSTRYGTVSLF